MAQKPDVKWSAKDKANLQTFLDSWKTGWPDIGHTEPGFDPEVGHPSGAIADPLDPTLLATHERVHPEQIPARQVGDKRVHPEVLEGGMVGANLGDAEQMLRDLYSSEDPENPHGGPVTWPGMSNRALPGVMPRSGPLVNTPLVPRSGGSQINVPLTGLPGGSFGGSLLPGPGFKPGQGISMQDLLALKARMQAQAHGHPIARQRVA